MSATTVGTRVCVVGCGAIGSLFAAHLGRLDEVEVWALDISADHVAAMAANGIRVIGRESFSAPVHATTDPVDIPPCAFGIVATKSMFTRAAIEAASAPLAGAAVVSMQNGIGNEEVIAEFVPRVLRGTTLPAGTLTAPGVVRFDAPGDSWIGPFEPKPATLEEVALLAGLLTRSGLTTHGMPDARGAQWTKLIFNCSTNPLGALTGLSTGPLCDIPALRDLTEGLIQEGRDVAAALGIELETDPSVMLDDAMARAYWHKASMLQDVRAGRQTEIDALNGALARTARLVGVATPLHDALVALVQGLDASRTIETPEEA